MDAPSIPDLTPARPVGKVRLRLPARTRRGGEPVASDVSVLALDGQTLWCASDETAHVERLCYAGGGTFAEHARFALADVLALPAGRGGEADIEGLCVDGDWLWVVGSHALKRARPRPGAHDAAESLRRLTRVERQPNRYLLARIPLRAGGDGLRAPAPGGAMLAARRKGGNALTRSLAQDPHLGPFLGIPSKDNGLDVEGIAACGARVFLGLRGPVLRGWAVVLELLTRAAGGGRLKARRIGPGGARFRKHFLDLEGLGVRALVRRGDDLLVLAGPTMDLDGPVRVFLWRGALAARRGESVVPRAALTRLLTLPHGVGTDHAEGMAVVPDGAGGERLLVVYDSPDPARLHDGGASLDCDLFDLGGR